MTSDDFFMGGSQKAKQEDLSQEEIEDKISPEELATI